MFAGMRRIFGNIKVTETDREIRVEGVPADVMYRDISKIWKTSRINMHMFNSLSKNAFSFNPFFAVEIVYMLDVLMASRNRSVSVRVLDNIRTELLNNTWLSHTKPNPDAKGRLDFGRLSLMSVTPEDYQQQFLEDYSFKLDQYLLNGTLLAAAPGTGKTITSLMVAECLAADLVVVVSPKPALYKVWDADITKAYQGKTRPTQWISAEGKDYNGERYAIFQYEHLDDLLAMIQSGAFKEFTNIAMILDESHNMNEMKSLRTQLWVECCKQIGSKNILPMSGTAIKALGAEAIPLLKALCDNFNADAEERFKKIFGRDGSKGMDILQHRIGTVSFKVETGVLNMAPPIMETLRIQIPNGNAYTLESIKKDMQAFIEERFKYYAARRQADQKFWDECMAIHKAGIRNSNQQKEFNTYQNNLKIVIATPDPRFIGEIISATNSYEKKVFLPSLPKAMHDRFKETKTIIKYLKLKIQGEALGRVLGRKRIECHVDMVPHIDFVKICESTMKKTVVFTSFVQALEKMEQHCQTLGLTPVAVYGKTNNELNAIVDKFRDNKDINPLGATFQSLSTAVPLVMADTMIMINHPFRAYIYDQAISRIWRKGADTQTYVYSCQLDTGDAPNISTRSSEILAWSTAQVEAILGIKSPFTPEEVQGMEAYEMPFKEEGIDDDESLYYYNVLTSSFEQFDITISKEDFGLAKVIEQRPAYLRW